MFELDKAALDRPTDRHLTLRPPFLPRFLFFSPFPFLFSVVLSSLTPPPLFSPSLPLSSPFSFFFPGRFSEATIGSEIDEDRETWLRLFNTALFQTRGSNDVAAVEMCGTLKNVVAIGAGFVDGLGEGNNAKAAIMRVGFGEMIKLIKRAFPTTHDGTFLESCGIADLITTCYGGRNRKCAEAFVVRGGSCSFDEIERELLSGQKLQGVLTSHEVQELLETWGAEEEFPLFVTINRIIKGDIPAKDITRYKEMPSKNDYLNEGKRKGKKSKMDVSTH